MTNYLCIFADDKRTASKLSTGGKGLVRVGLSDKGVGTSTLFLSSSSSLAIFCFLSLSASFILRRYFISLSFSCNLLLRVMARAHSLLFFSSFRIPNFIFIGRRFRARARARVLSRESVETMVCLAAN